MIRLLRALIDSAALRHNLGTIRAYAPGSKVMAVIKANAYGHGLVSTALALGDADAFAVARLEEGITLRAAGVRAPIVLLDTEAGSAGVETDADIVAGVLKSHQQAAFACRNLHVDADVGILSRPGSVAPDGSNALVCADSVALALVADLPAGAA